MSAYALNEGTCVSDIFVIVNFVDASKKRINPAKNMGENIFKFWNDRDSERIGDCCW